MHLLYIIGIEIGKKQFNLIHKNLNSTMTVKSFYFPGYYSLRCSEYFKMIKHGYTKRTHLTKLASNKLGGRATHHKLSQTARIENSLFHFLFIFISILYL